MLKSGISKGQGKSKRHTDEKIIGILRETEVTFAQKMADGQACQLLSIFEQAYCGHRH